MRNVSLIIVFFVQFLLLLALAVPIGLSGELISPTRTLRGSQEPFGILTVVSEPPGLNVFLDGSELGQTPIFLKKVRPGSHTLRVKQAETDIDVAPGKILQIIFFKGSFTARMEEFKTPAKSEEKRPAKGEGIVADPSLCTYGYYEEPTGVYHCYYGGWGTHVCETTTGLKECVARGNKAFSCEQLRTNLRSKDCCQENFGGFSKSFSLDHCGIE